MHEARSPLWGSGGMLPQENFEFQAFEIASGVYLGENYYYIFAKHEEINTLKFS